MIGRADMQTANREFKADSIGRRDEDRSLSGFVGTGRDALTTVWTVANHPDVVACLHELRRRLTRERHHRRDEIKQGKIKSLASRYPDVPRTGRCSNAD